MERIPEYLQKMMQDKRLLNVLDTIFDGIYIVDRHRNILFWNKGAENITGFSKKEVSGKKCSENILNHIDENGILLCKSHCPLAESMKTDSNKMAKVYPKSKEGNRFPTLTHIAPIKDDDGQVVGGIEVFRDISKEEDYKILQEKFNVLIKKYISKTTYKEVMQQVEYGKSKGNTLKDMTILYLDIVDFTPLSEKLKPSEVADLLNDFFGICNVITHEYHGDIDKFMGDSIMATFIDANDAVEAAKKILNALRYFNKDRLKNKEQNIELHLGLNSGNVIQVEVGTKDRKDFTVLGDTVNTASRIQGISDPNTILISEATYLRLKKQDEFIPIGERLMKGKEVPIKIYKFIDF